MKILQLLLSCDLFVRINIAPTAWQYLTAGIFIMVIVPVSTLVVNRWFSPTPHERENKLQQQMADNTKASNQLISNLKENLENLTIEKEQRERLIAIVIHDLKSPLRFLSMHMDKLQENLKGMNPEDLESYTLLLKNTVSDIYHFTQDVLLWLNNQKGDFAILKKDTDLTELIYKTSRLYQDICLSKNNRMEINIPENLIVNTASDLLNVIIRNLLDNANKFTEDGTITITTGIKDKSAYIMITDTGMGMELETSSALINNNLDNRAIQPVIKHLGYKIINDLVTKLGGSITIVSELNVGTSVTVLIPA
jgi:signal transduction histidine kinase